jgi:aminoglycoside 2'-N-acetyltransferase I
MTIGASSGPRWRTCASAGLTTTDRAALWTLWQAAFDGRSAFSRDDEEHAYGGVHVLALEGDAILAHGSVVPREIVVGERPFRAGYVEAVAVRPGRQRTGIGTALMTRLGAALRARHELGVLSTGRARGFYERLGWERWRGASYVLRDGGRIRTADEDEGLMVLLFGASAQVDLGADIACHDRSGDAW